MSQIEEAMERFSQALDRLEGALNKRADADKQTDTMRREVLALREDRSRLQSELEETRGAYEALDGAANDIGERVDRTIEELREILGS
jgi:chromosome segregation ATPase